MTKIILRLKSYLVILEVKKEVRQIVGQNRVRYRGTLMFMSYLGFKNIRIEIG